MNISEFPVAALLGCLSYLDVQKREVPNEGVLALFFYALVFSSDLIAGLISGGYTFLLLYGVYRLSKGSLGGGDVKLLAALAFFLGAEFHRFLLCFLVVLLAGFLGGVVVRKNVRFTVPLVPYIFAAYLLWLGWSRILH